MTHNIVLGCIDLQCVDCDKWMGHLTLENPSEQQVKDIMAFLNKANLMPICDICSTTKGTTVVSTKPYE